MTQQAVEKDAVSEDWSESLHFFVEDDINRGDWVVVNHADNFDDTLTLLDSIAERLREQKVKDDSADIMKSVGDDLVAGVVQQATATSNPAVL